MNDREYETRLLNLAFLVGTDGVEDQFAEEYEALLYAVKASPGPRFAKLMRLKKVLLQQTAYLMSEWLKEKRNPGHR
jgi:hypothetical protein